MWRLISAHTCTLNCTWQQTAFKQNQRRNTRSWIHPASFPCAHPHSQGEIIYLSPRWTRQAWDPDDESLLPFMLQWNHHWDIRDAPGTQHKYIIKTSEICQRHNWAKGPWDPILGPSVMSWSPNTPFHHSIPHDHLQKTTSEVVDMWDFKWQFRRNYFRQLFQATISSYYFRVLFELLSPRVFECNQVQPVLW